MSHAKDIAEGARNLLVNCGDLGPDDTLLIVCEDPDLGWYDNETVQAITDEALSLIHI